MNTNVKQNLLGISIGLICGAVATPAISAITLEEALAMQKEQRKSSLSPVSPNRVNYSDINVDSNISDDTYSNNELTKGYTAVKADTGETIYLSDTERLLIDTKKEAILKHLLEQDRLEEARSLLKESLRKVAYDDAVEKEFSLTPDEIRKIKKQRAKVSEAENSPINNVELKISTRDLDIDASTPITVNVKNGYSSSIAFYDQAGRPWPIQGDILGDPTNFAKQVTTPDKNIGVFDIKKDFKQSNALINLSNQNQLIVLKLVGSDNLVDARMTVRIPKLGPNSQGLITSGTEEEKVASLSPILMSILNGDKPVGSRAFKVKGIENTTATVHNGMLYIRTKSKLLSPPPLNSAQSPTGYNAYEINPVNKLLVSDAGELKSATIEKAIEVKINHKTTIFD